MKKILLSACLLLGATTANSAIIDFEGLGRDVIVGDGYANLNWNTNNGDIYTTNKDRYGASGYQVVAISTNSDTVAYNGYGYNPADITAIGPNNVFSVNSGVFASAWDALLTVTFEGYLDGVLKHTMTAGLSNTTASLLSFNFSNIDTFRMLDQGSQIAFDNLDVDYGVSQVPVPAAVWLFGTGLAGLMGVSRKKKQALAA